MINRRNFIKTLTLSGLAFSTLAVFPQKIFSKNEKFQKRIKPKHLTPGDKVGVIAPASYIKDEEKDKILENLKKIELIGELAPNLMKRKGYLAGTDAERVEDLHNMFSRKDIKAILCARGGYGTPRILNKIDYNLIQKNPKIILGYSDITALLQAIYVKTGLITFHGPVGISTFNDFSINYIKAVLFNVNQNIELISEKIEEKENNSINEILTIREGIAEGYLIGGNLSLVVSLIGSEYDFNPENKLIYLEEIGEEPYRIDKMLTQLLLTKKLQKCKGLILGNFANCEPKKDDPEFESSLSLKEVLFDRLSDLNIPIIYGLSFGHIKNKFVLPNGIKARLDTQKQLLTLLESPVI